MDDVPVVGAAEAAAQQVSAVRDDPAARLDLMRAAYVPAPGNPPLHLRYRRAALAFMGWQVERGLLNPSDHPRPGSPWWRAANERLLRDACEARLRLLGSPGPESGPSVGPSIRFAQAPSVLSWYRAHNVSVARAYLEHRDLAEGENRSERFFLNVVLMRVLYAHALVAAPRLALGRLGPIAPFLGDPRRAMTGIFLSMSRVLPNHYPLHDDLGRYIARENTLGRLLDLGVITPRLQTLYSWSADELGLPEVAELYQDGIPSYAWDPQDKAPWQLPPNRIVRLAKRAVPPADARRTRPRPPGQGRSRT